MSFIDFVLLLCHEHALDFKKLLILESFKTDLKIPYIKVHTVITSGKTTFIKSYITKFLKTAKTMMYTYFKFFLYTSVPDNQICNLLSTRMYTLHYNSM